MIPATLHVIIRRIKVAPIIVRAIVPIVVSIPVVSGVPVPVVPVIPVISVVPIVPVVMTVVAFAGHVSPVVPGWACQGRAGRAVLNKTASWRCEGLLFAI